MIRYKKKLLGNNNWKKVLSYFMYFIVIPQNLNFVKLIHMNSTFAIMS